MIKYILVLFGILTSASAQIMLKKSSGFQNWSRPWFIFILLSAFVYFVSFVLYFHVLKRFPISKIYPIMTICVILLITSYGFFIGEKISTRQMVGLLIGICSIYLIFA